MSKNYLSRMGSFKNNSKTQEMRQRRQQVTAELRKNKKLDQLMKSRNIGINDLSLQESTEPIILNIEDILIYIQSNSPTLQFQAVQSVRKMLSCGGNPPIEYVISLGLVPFLIKFLDDYGNSQIQYESAWALTNIASGTSGQTKLLLNEGIVPKVITLLKSTDLKVAEQAAWALRNITGDGSEARDFVLGHGIIYYLTELVQNPYIEVSLLRKVALIMSNLCCKKNNSPPLKTILELMPALAYLLNHVDEEILSNVCWALSYVAGGTTEKVQAVISHGCVPRLMDLLGAHDSRIVRPALRTIGNIAAGNDSQTDVILNANVLPILGELLLHQKSSIVKSAAWTLSNITAGNHRHIQACLDSNIFVPLSKVLKYGNFKAQREAVLTITNLTEKGTDKQIYQLIYFYKCLKPYTSLLTSVDASIVKEILSGLVRILRCADAFNDLETFCFLLDEFGAVDKLEALQHHEDRDIYEMSCSIIDKYFNDVTGFASNTLGVDLEFNACSGSKFKF